MPGRILLIPALFLLAVWEVSVPFRSNSAMGRVSAGALGMVMSRKCGSIIVFSETLLACHDLLPLPLLPGKGTMEDLSEPVVPRNTSAEGTELGRWTQPPVCQITPTTNCPTTIPSKSADLLRACCIESETYHRRFSQVLWRAYIRTRLRIVR